MSELRIQGLSKRFGNGVPVVQGIDLTVHSGEFMVLVGPSGCGKSTTLRMVAGLEDPNEGSIFIDGVDVTERAPAERGVAMVFQRYALYPHMTVATNMGFGLRMAGLKPAEVEARVQRAARSLQLEPLLQRRPRELSGGQRQRVAIGRAIVREPKVFLFDEPLSNLDASLRTQMRGELAELHQRLGATIVYVTHDQVEAMTLGQRIAIFNAGRIEQVGANGLVRAAGEPVRGGLSRLAAHEFSAAGPGRRAGGQLAERHGHGRHQARAAALGCRGKRCGSAGAAGTHRTPGRRGAAAWPGARRR